MECQRTKVAVTSSRLSPPFRTPGSRYDHVHFDTVGPLPLPQGFTCLLTCVDGFIRWPEVMPVPDITADAISQAVVSMGVSRCCCPIIVITDRSR